MWQKFCGFITSDGRRKKSVPFVTILEKYWSTDWYKIFDLHGLQASEGFNSTNSETVKSFPSLSPYWINLKLRCLFVKLLFLQNTSKCSCSSILRAYFWNYCYLFCTLQNKCGREISNTLLKFWAEWSGRQNMHWYKGAKVTPVGIWGLEGWLVFVLELFSSVLQISKDALHSRRLCVEALKKGQVISLWKPVTSFRFCCWDIWKSQQYIASEEIHIWALNTLINVSRWFKGKNRYFIFFLENFSVAL